MKRAQGKGLSKEAIVSELRRIHKKLGRAPAIFECVEEGVTERQIRNFFGTLKQALIDVGVTEVESPELKTANELRLRLTKIKAEKSTLEQALKEARERVIATDSLRDLIHVTKNVGEGKIPNWLIGDLKRPRVTTGIPVLFLSDIHFDEVVKREQVSFCNEYSREIATRRIRHTFQSSVNLLKSHFKNPKYDGIVLALGGDLLSGNIHEELTETNEAPINVSIMVLTDLLIAGIELLASEFTTVFIPCVTGNHGRNSRKPKAKNRVHENYEWIVYENLRRYFRNNDNITFYIPEGADAQFSIYGKSFLLTHGDQFRGGTGIAGLFSPLMLGMARKQKRNNAFKKPFDVMMMGHWHTYVHTDQLIVNGSIKGVDEYAYQGNFGAERPQQALFIVHPVYGITFRMPVFCDPGEEYKGANKIEVVL